MYKFLLLFFLFFFVEANIQAQNNKSEATTRILFMFDCSNSMNGLWQTNTKIVVARKYFTQAIDSLMKLPNLQMALRFYGSQHPVPPQICDDTKLEVPFGYNNAEMIKLKIKNVTPQGTTPIAYSLEQAAGDFPPCDNCNNVIILITDGIEACNGDPCAVSLKLQQKKIFLKPFIIGIGLDLETKKAFECVGTYYDAGTEKDFEEILRKTVEKAIYTTTCQINLNKLNGKPEETNIPVTLYNATTGKLAYHFEHTFNAKGNPDTLIIDHSVAYNMTVHSLPPIFKSNIKLTVGKHNLIETEVVRGILQFTQEKGSEYRGMEIKISKIKDCNVLNYQPINKKQAYLAGEYRAEIGTIPPYVIENIKIEADKITEIKIPQPGMVTFLARGEGFGSVFIDKNGELTRIFDLDPEQMRETLLLQPGNYQVTFRPSKMMLTKFSITKKFEVKAGNSIMVELFN